MLLCRELAVLEDENKYDHVVRREEHVEAQAQRIRARHIYALHCCHEHTPSRGHRRAACQPPSCRAGGDDRQRSQMCLLDGEHHREHCAEDQAEHV
eukprot:3984683-Prymnesium_polylepis.1